MSSLDTRYAPQAIEEKWYKHWLEQNYFRSLPDERKPYTIVIPPPNVTGVLHMGHILNNTIQDVLIRHARMQGLNACWVPGTDHASIATEAKVVRWLRDEKKLRKGDLTREQFIDYAWQWTHKYGGIILNQLQKLGASCDWERTAFTMDEIRYEAVIKTFVDLYRKGKLYRGYRMVNWDPEALTVLSNEEVIYGAETSKLHHVRYLLADDPHQFITVATTRPETILGDTAIAVHPEDERYKSWVGKMVLVPLANRPIPIIADSYVDREFGTGALKITPAHDPNDYEIGLRHNLPVLDTLNADGTMSEAAGFFIGEDKYVARKKMVAWLEEHGQLAKLEDYEHQVGRSERTNAVVEPRLSMQWYVRMKDLAEPALRAVVEQDIRFYPDNMKNTYRHWMENIRDWCISRQLWWGQRIPAYYLVVAQGADKELVFVAESVDEALAEAQLKTGRSLTAADLYQDEDVLDTWFSSWLWPISVFNGFRDERELKYYYPTQVLVTGWDIMFLWVARMIMSGYEYRQDKPFGDVYFTGMVRDKQRRKMSKSLGNSPDALQLIADYGADGVRYGVLSASPAGGDILFDDKLCEQGRNFCNKIWNACRLVKGWEVKEKSIQPENSAAMAWFAERLKQVASEVEAGFQQYRLSEAVKTLYSFIWDDFCSWYLEMVKPAYGEPLDRQTYDTTIGFFEQLMKLLHPFMPFITEEIWHQLRDRDGVDCIVQAYPQPQTAQTQVIANMDYVKALIAQIRDTRNQKQIKQKESFALTYRANPGTADLLHSAALRALVTKLANLTELLPAPADDDRPVTFVLGADKYFFQLDHDQVAKVDVDALQKERDYILGFIRIIAGKLANERFVANAPADVIDRERKKLQDGQSRLAVLEETLKGSS